jgi:hypothetical protein
MARFYRRDFGSLGDVERTPQGGIKVPATLTRAGVFTYASPTGEPIYEWRPLAEVQKADSLGSLRGAPLTVDHPPSRIEPSNFRQFTTGHVGDDVRMEKDKVAATLYVNDAEAIRAIDAGRREVSCGYHCDVDETPGVVPDGEPDAGKPYHRIQRGIGYNHLALVPDGRAGADVRLRLDSAGDVITEESESMDKIIETKIEMIEGVEYTVGTPAHAKARNDVAEKAQAQKAEIAKLRADAQKDRERADSASKALGDLRTKVKSTLTVERLDAAVKARAGVVVAAQRILGKEFKADGRTNGAIKRAVIAKVHPEIKLDGASKDFVNGLWRGVLARLSGGEKVRAAEGGERTDAAERLLRDTAPFPSERRDAAEGSRKLRSVEQARQDAIDEGDTRSSRPLALSRRDKFKPLSSHPMLQGAQLEVEK